MVLGSRAVEQPAQRMHLITAEFSEIRSSTNHQQRFNLPRGSQLLPDFHLPL